MNARELADALLKNLTMEYGSTDDCMEQAAIMLRELEDRNAELEKELNHMRSFFGCDPAYYGMTSAEPIAWVYPEGLEQLKNGNPWTAYGIGDDGRIPLYTTPQTKPLSDEEIEKVRVVIMDTAYWCADNGESESYNTVKVMCGEVLAMLRREK